jgi:uncharacterized membrane-anchored protein YjiN (DUF445 family)
MDDACNAFAVQLSQGPMNFPTLCGFLKYINDKLGRVVSADQSKKAVATAKLRDFDESNWKEDLSAVMQVICTVKVQDDQLQLLAELLYVRNTEQFQGVAINADAVETEDEDKKAYNEDIACGAGHDTAGKRKSKLASAKVEWSDPLDAGNRSKVDMSDPQKVQETIDKVDEEIDHEIVKLRKLQKYRIELKQVLKEMADSGRAAAGRGKTAKK